MSKSGKYPSGAALHELFREVFATQAILSRLMDLVHETAGLTTSQRKIMRILKQREAATVPDIAAALNVSRQFVQTVADNLVTQGLLELQENPRHKRSRLAVLTENGHRIYELAQQNENKIIEQFMPDIGNAETTATCDSLTKIRMALESLEKQISQGTQSTNAA